MSAADHLPGREPRREEGTSTLWAVAARTDQHAVLSMAGVLDRSTVHLLNAAVADCLRERPGRLTLDVRELTHCAACGVRALREAHADAWAQVIEFSLLGPPGWLLHLLSLIGAGDLLAVCDSGEHPGA